MCMAEFEQMSTPKQRAQYVELFKEIKCVGKGAFGAAYLVMSKQSTTKEFFIAKKIIMAKLSERERRAAELEADLLKSLDSQYIVQYKNMFKQENGKILVIIMEYCQYGDLSEQLKRAVKAEKKLNEDQVMYWFIQLLMALRDIHKQKILHRDIKSLNVFISKGNLLKIGDFGISQPETQAMKAEFCGTLIYMAPEIINKKPYS